MFTGFTPETIDFLWGIRMNNNREWFFFLFSQYTATLYEPMKALGQELFQPFLSRSGDVLKVSRIYRDARLHHAEPYKESLWICIRKDVEWWAENPCLYFEIRPEGVSYGFTLWKPKAATMEAFRRRLAAQPEEFLATLDSVQKALGMEVSAVCYKKPKEAPQKELSPFYAWKEDISLTVHKPVGEDIFGPELGQRAKTFLEQLIPLYDYFNFVTQGLRE